MHYLVLMPLTASQLLVMYFLYKKTSPLKDAVVLAVIHLLGIMSVWYEKVFNGFSETWLIIAAVVYQWVFAFILLYINKKIKEQQG
ncbi:hypothetical protein OS175_10615 [Marinicella sp. S1101]|uniref:hypothetical protein n=1 Tax=Marinicella marina TaxID=2996016 RepID=UPI0022610393|nr:hypothetical protein [Marinicella marina]MCX7554333.1 hypothetical protein [Marinicella marina]MDJ1138676.1 hypothetical protein [Marinicella marina]